MADLDDFFAKKDRKKSKGKKFTTTDEIAKKLEETGKKQEKEKAKKDKTTMQSQPPGTETDEQGNAIQEEDEWREFEEQKKDYSGLRIGKLQIQEGDEGGGEDDGEEEQVLEENEAGVMVLRSRKVQAGPWKMQQQQLQQQQLQQQQQQQHQQQQQTQQQPPPEERPPLPPENLDTTDKRSDGPSSYVPPALRGGQHRDREFGATIGGPRASRMKIAPDISNEESFPTLSASKNMDANSPWGRRRRDEGTFEEVRKGGSMSSRYDAGRLATGGPKLSLGNKFGALQDQS